MVEPGGESKRQSFESQRSKVTQWRTQAEAIGPGCSNSWPGPTRWIFSDYRPGGKSSSSSGSVQEKGNASASRLSRYRGVLAGGAIATATAARRPLALSPQTRSPASIRVAPAPAPVARPGGGLGARAVPHAAAAAGEPLLPGARGGVGVRGQGVVRTNPVSKTSVDSGLSPAGLRQAARAALELQRLGACEDDCWIWPSITQRAYQAAEIIAAANEINRRCLPPPISVSSIALS